MSFFGQTPKVIVDDAKIRELLTRGVERIYPSMEFLEKRLQSGERLTVYLGIDPTGPTLHIGHVIPLLKLRQFQELGHRVIILIGGFTAQIGDPTDKLAARQPLTPEQIAKNARNYKKFIGKILDLKSANICFLDNQVWSNKLKPVDVLKIASYFTASQLLERDMFQERLKHGKEVHANELLYPVFQAYDAVAMNVDIQVGGNDQTFNMLAGRTLMRKMKNKEKFVVAMKLLVDHSGKKMGKTVGNMVTMEDVPSEMFGKIMSWPDSMIISGFELCTLVPVPEIEEMKKRLERGANPKDLKLKLAEAVVSLLHGEGAAKKAHAGFEAAFSEGKPEEFTPISLQEDTLSDQMILKGFISSKSDLRRLIAEGAVTNLDSGEKMGEDFLKAAPPGKYRIGKHRFVNIR